MYVMPIRLLTNPARFAKSNFELQFSTNVNRFARIENLIFERQIHFYKLSSLRSHTNLILERKILVTTNVA